MATVDYARLIGPHGFNRACAIKRLHPHFAKDAEFVEMFIDEARLSARLQHANIVATFDVIARPGELALVMDYVHGESLWTLLKLASSKGEPVPVEVALWLIASVCHGLHAAHEARADDGTLLGVVHRDVSPHNILVGADGVPRVSDFGIAKALNRSRMTPAGEIRGKFGYIAPEQLQGRADRRTDVYGAAVVLWETLAGFPLFAGGDDALVLHRVLNEPVSAPSEHVRGLPPGLDDIVLRALQRDPSRRFASALELAVALESIGTATQSAASAWVANLAGTQLAERLEQLRVLQMRRAELAKTARTDAAAASATRRLQPTPPPSYPAQGEGSTSSMRRRRSLGRWLMASLLLGGATVLAFTIPSPEPAPAPLPAEPRPNPAPPTPSEIAPVSKQEPAPEPTQPSKPATVVSDPGPKPNDRRRPPRPSHDAVEPPPRKCLPIVYRDGIRQVDPSCSSS